MLNIFNVKLKNSKYKGITNEYKGNDLGPTRHYPPANKEWFNSIYAYNKNTPKLLPIADKVLSKLTKSYFNLYSVKLEKKIKSRRVRKWSRRLSTNRILISKAELKHTSDKVIITIYVYNRQEENHIKKMRKINIIGNIKKKNKRSFIWKIRLIKRQALKIVTRIRKEKNLLLKTFKWENNQFKNYEKQYYKSFMVRSLAKEMLYLYLKQIISFNKSKFENTYLLPLTNLVEKVYNKKVEFNLVNLKYLHLNSHIFTETIATKLRTNKKLLRVLKASMRMVKITSFNKLTILQDISNRQNIIQNLKVNLLLSDPVFLNRERQSKDDLELILARLFPKSMQDRPLKDIVNTVLNSIKYKPVSGIRIEAAGRLSRRIIAQRSVFKFKYKGHLRNIDSSHKGFSSVILRGHAKSNLQYTKVKSKTRIGSFGLKGWISSY